MMIAVTREIFSPQFTLGSLRVNGHMFCYTCEDAVRETDEPVENWKIKGRTAIPRGTYQVVITMSNRFKKELPLLLSVPGFEGIRIHSGNVAADTEGCLLVGLTRTNEGVGNSRAAMDLLMPELEEAIANGSQITLEIS